MTDTSLIADVGGTNTRCALLDENDAITAVEVLKNDNHDSLAGALEAYLATTSGLSAPSRGAIAVAAPIIGDRVEMTNRGWHFSIQEMRARLGLEELKVVNDFVAQAASVPFLDDGELVKIGGGSITDGAAKAVIGPGTGLGVSGLIPHSGGWAIISGEGGHVTLAGTTDRENEVIERVRNRYDHCSAERVLSGPGLVNLYGALLPEDESVPAPAEITKRAMDGEDRATEAMDLFFAFLGTVAADLALTLGAYGGVYLAGGILPAVMDSFEKSGFRQRFESKGRYRHHMERIPTFVITASTPALTGLGAIVSGRI